MDQMRRCLCTLPVSDRFVTDVWILGATEPTIEYVGYATNAATLSASL